jgi:SsrA-binding protein
MEDANEKVISVNRKARHEYFLEEYLEAGLELTGTEIKSIRQGSVSFKEAYVDFVGHEAFVRDMHIAPYDHGNLFNHQETRPRKLLLHKREIAHLQKAIKLKGYTVVPTRMYLKRGICKLEIALAKGKDLYDKRQTEKERSVKRTIEQAMKVK